MTNDVHKAIKIKDIAKALGISIGTVDRALHNRGRIKPHTKEQVLRMAASLGYRPNPAARALASKQRLRIAVNLPAQIAPFWDAVREGIREQARTFAASGVEVESHTFPRLGQGEEAAFEEALRSGVSGIIMATGRPEDLHTLIGNASRSQIPVVAVTTDAPGTPRLAVVSVDSLASGALAGELLGRLSQGLGKLAVITGDLKITDHAEKFQSFRDSVASLSRSTRVLPPLQNHEDETEAYKECTHLLKCNPDLKGLYVSTANSAPVLTALRDQGQLGHLPVIATDLFPTLIQHLQAGNILATLYQRPSSQGQIAMRILHDFLVEGRCVAQQIHLAPHLIMRSNLRFFLEHLYLESDGRGPKPFESEREVDHFGLRLS